MVGVGGLGCPAALSLVRAGVQHLALIDDDEVDVTNLHRQILYRDEDVGVDKLQAARQALVREGFPESRLELIHDRFLPENALDLMKRYDVVVEGADNFATKFLVADAGHLGHCPVVHGAAVRWNATVMATAPRGCPCYRCLFEDLPEVAPNCAEAGVVGPVLGIAGALMAEAALRIATEDDPPFGTIYTIDGKNDRLRQVKVQSRAGCLLCGPAATILDLAETRYLGTACST